MRDAELADRIRMLRFHGSKAKIDVRAHRLQLAPRRAPGGGAAHLPARARRLDRPSPRGRGALRGARARRAVRATGRRAGTRLPPRRLPLAGARPHPGRAHRGGHRERAVLPPAAPPPAGAPLPRLRGRLAPRDRARRGRELLGAVVGRDLARAAGARRRDRARSRRRPVRGRDERADQPASVAAAGGRPRDHPRGLVPRLPAPLRPGSAQVLRVLPQLGDPRPRRRAEAGRVRALRLLQPLVALRLDARHVGCCPRCHGRLAPHLPRLHALRHPRGARAALGLGDRLAADARARRGVADARADDHRAAADELDRGTRQGGDRRRGGRRGAADAPRDAAHARARLHADRADRRRPAQEEPAAARHPRARNERRSSATSSATAGRTSS